MFDFNMPDFMVILPEMILVLVALAMIVDGAIAKVDTQLVVKRFHYGAIISLLLSGAIMIMSFGFDPIQTSFDGMYVHDGYTTLIKLMIIVTVIGTLMIGLPAISKPGLNQFEYPVLLMFATVGMMVMVSANDLLALFIGLELQAMPLYVVVAMRRDRLITSEAALKYFLLGALATGMFLYGASFIYGYVGSTNFDSIGAILRYSSGNEVSIGILVGLVFMMASFAFKISAVPFHMWTPDVYQGSPMPVAAFLSAAPKLAAIAMILRVMINPFGDISESWQQVIVLISVASMVLGSFAALRQSDIKRLLAYSSIGHMGYALIGLAAGSENGAQAVLIYMFTYLISVLGAFGVLIALRGRGGRSIRTLEDLSGISGVHPKLALLLTLFMFSMAGIPPMFGFLGKMMVFMAAIDAQLYSLAIIGVLSSVVGSFYYIRIIKIMYFDKKPDKIGNTYGEVIAINMESSCVLVICGFITAFGFFYPIWLLDATHMATVVLFN